MKNKIRFCKFRNKQLTEMDEIIIALKAKQKVLNERAKIMHYSYENQQNRLSNIYTRIDNTINSLLTNKRHSDSKPHP